jgi:hypothetical protein
MSVTLYILAGALSHMPLIIIAMPPVPVVAGRVMLCRPLLSVLVLVTLLFCGSGWPVRGGVVAYRASITT